MKLHPLFFVPLSSFIFVLTATHTHANSYDSGMDAYQNNQYDQAISIWKPLAEQGHAQAAYNLGFIYEFGYGVAPRDDEAFAWYLLAALQAHAQAQHTVAWMYERGKGVKQDHAQALQWMSLIKNAAEAGVSPRDDVIQERMLAEQLQSELQHAAERYDFQKAAGPRPVFELEASNTTS